jgi:hypothetical protein
MSKYDELKRLQVAMNEACEKDGGNGVATGNYAIACMNAVPAMIDDLKAATELVRLACVDHGEHGEPVRYGHYVSDDEASFIPPSELPNIPALEDDLAAANAEVEQLKGIVAKLPVTADGAPVVPGMTVWACHGITGEAQSLHVDSSLDPRQYMGPLDGIDVKYTYSTKDAALAAKAPASPITYDHATGEHVIECSWCPATERFKAAESVVVDWDGWNVRATEADCPKCVEKMSK